MNACERAHRWVVEALSGELDDSGQRALSLHLADCEKCAGEFQTLKGAWQALDSAPEPATPSALRSQVLARVRAARESETVTPSRMFAPLRVIVPALLAALASVALLVAHDPDCRSPLAIACCSALWAGVYGLGFAVFLASRKGTPARSLAARALVAAAGGMFLVRLCPTEPGQSFALPLLSAMARVADTMPAVGFALGLALGAAPLVLAILVVRTVRPSLRGELATAGIYFSALAPALYLESSTLALTGLIAVLAGAAVGVLAPPLLELALRRPALGGAR